MKGVHTLILYNLEKSIHIIYNAFFYRKLCDQNMKHHSIIEGMDHTGPSKSNDIQIKQQLKTLVLQEHHRTSPGASPEHHQEHHQDIATRANTRSAGDHQPLRHMALHSIKH